MLRVVRHQIYMMKQVDNWYITITYILQYTPRHVLSLQVMDNSLNNVLLLPPKKDLNGNIFIYYHFLFFALRSVKAGIWVLDFGPCLPFFIKYKFYFVHLILSHFPNTHAYFHKWKSYTDSLFFNKIKLYYLKFMSPYPPAIHL